MLIAHIVPGYVIAVATEPHWDDEWTPLQRQTLWTAALGSAVLPDADVVYNTVCRGFANHSTLYTHSLFPYLVLGIVSIGFFALGKANYLRTLLLLIALGAFSHIVLDVIAHNTPLFYPLSNDMIGKAPARITNGGIAQYLTHPLFLLEPALLIVGIWIWLRRRYILDVQRRWLRFLIGGWLLFSALYLIFLPTLQRAADRHF